jgi:hypothetical protein
MPKLVRIATVPLSFSTLLKRHLRFMSQYYDLTAISSDAVRLEKVGINESVKTYPVELTRQITLLKDLKALYKLYVYWQFFFLSNLSLSFTFFLSTLFIVK